MHFPMVELHQAFPQQAELLPNFRLQSAVNPVVEQHQLRFFRVFRVFPYQDIAGMRVAMDMSELKDHSPEGLDQQTRAIERFQLQILLDCGLIIDFHGVLNELHGNNASGAEARENLGNIHAIIRGK